VQCAAVLFYDDLVADGQPQAGAFPHLLGGEEGFKDALSLTSKNRIKNAVISCPAAPLLLGGGFIYIRLARQKYLG
jgi:hypothetical protein